MSALYSACEALAAKERQEAIDAEKNNYALLIEMIDNNIEVLSSQWKFGDGDGGMILSMIRQAVTGEKFKSYPSGKPSKAKISAALSKSVFERDAYRCKHCGTHLDLSVDHIHPESKGGETKLHNLQTLCRSCNSKKGVSHDNS